MMPTTGPKLSSVITRMACLKSLESNDGKRGVQVGDSILVRRYQPPVEQEEPESEPEPVNQIAANSSLKVTAAAFVPRPKAPKPLAAPETPVEEYEGVIEIVPYTLNELHIKLDHGDVQQLSGDDWRIDRLANRITYTRQIESLYELLEPNDPTKKAICNTNPVFRQILTAGFQRPAKDLADELAAAIGSLNVRGDDKTDGIDQSGAPPLAAKEPRFNVCETQPWLPGCEMVERDVVPTLCQGTINPTGDLSLVGPYDRRRQRDKNPQPEHVAARRHESGVGATIDVDSRAAGNRQDAHVGGHRSRHARNRARTRIVHVRLEYRGG